MRRPGASLPFAVPIMLAPLVLLALAPDELEWWQFGWYGAYFLVGYLLYADERLLPAARRDLVPALVVGALAGAGLVGLDFGGWVAAHQDAAYVYDSTYLAMIDLYAAGGWALTLVMLNVGLRAAPMQRPLPRYAGEAGLPAYVLHHPVAVAAAFAVVPLSLGLLPKAGNVVGATFVLTLALVALALRVPVARALLGAKPRAGAARTPAPGSPTVAVEIGDEQAAPSPR